MDNFGQNLKNYLNCDASEIFKYKKSNLNSLYNFRKICLLIGIVFLALTVFNICYASDKYSEKLYLNNPSTEVATNISNVTLTKYDKITGADFRIGNMGLNTPYQKLLVNAGQFIASKEIDLTFNYQTLKNPTIEVLDFKKLTITKFSRKSIDKDFVVDLISAYYMTPRGIKAGNTVDDIYSVYPYSEVVTEENGDQLIIYNLGSDLIFHIKNNIVTCVEISAWGL